MQTKEVATRHKKYTHRRPNRISQKGQRSTSAGKEMGTGHRTQPGATRPAIFGTGGLSALASAIRKEGYSGAEMLGMLNPGGLLGTEEKRLAFLANLYRTVSSHPSGYTYKFKANENASTSIVGILDSMEGSMDLYYGFNISQDKQGNVQFLYHEPVEEMDQCIFIHPCDFLPYLEKHDNELFILAWRLLSLLQSKHGNTFDVMTQGNVYGIDLYNEFCDWIDQGGPYDDKDMVPLEETGDTITMKAIKQAREDYGKKGNVHKWSWIFAKDNNSSVKRWLSAFKGFRANTKLRQRFMKWLTLGHYLIESGKCIEDYQNQEADQGIVVLECFLFAWSIDDAMTCYYKNDICYRATNEGYPSPIRAIYTPLGEKIKAPKDAYPGKLSEFYAEGKNISEYIKSL